MDKVSFIIVNYKTPEITVSSIKSIKENIFSVEYEILVVDNASGDNSVETLRKEFPEITIIEAEKNFGFGTAVNIGAEKASGNFLLVLNSDIIIEADYLSELIDYYTRNDCGVIGVKLLAPNGKIQKSFSYFPSYVNVIFLQTAFFSGMKIKAFSRYGNIDFENAESGKVDWVTGAFMFLSKENFDSVGGFDEKFFMYYEDVDLCRKLALKGKSACYLAEYSAIHAHSASVDSANKTMPEYNFYKVKELESAVYYVSKYYPSRLKKTLRAISVILFFKKFIFRFKFLLTRKTPKGNKNKHKLLTVKEKIKVVKSAE